MTTSLSPSEKSYIITGLSHATTPTRLDGRGLLDTRPIEISYDVAPQANGSARILLAGGTEVIAGIKLEVTDVDQEPKKGKEGWRGKVEVDVTPQAYPALSSSAVNALSSQYSTIISEHFLPSVPALPILPPTKYFVPHLHLTLLSSSTGSVLPTLIIAARLAFSSLLVPKIKRIGWEAVAAAEETELDKSGIKSAVRMKSKGKSRATEDWDLDRDDGTVETYMEGRKSLPVLITLNLVPGSDAFFLDASNQEEAACLNRIHVFVNGKGAICGLRMEGDQAIDAGRIRPLIQQAHKIASDLIGELNAQLPK